MSETIEEIALNHAMKHFEIHAAQRLTAFNFFIVISGAILAAIAASLQKPTAFAWAGAALGILLMALSFIFWKLDRRTSFLIKHSEAAIKKFEFENLATDYRVFSNEELESKKHKKKHRCIRRMLSYSEAFGLLFIGSGLMGLAGALTLLFSPEIFVDRGNEENAKVHSSRPSDIGTKATEENENLRTDAEHGEPGKSVSPDPKISKDVDPDARHQQSGS